LEMIRRGVFAALGKGTVDLAQVLGALESVSYDGWIVIEQDAAANPLEDAITSREYLEAFASGN
jgi:sugar phosphate isomerase/epimerase